MNSPEASLLGKVATYADRYDAALLYPLPRAAQRALIGVAERPVFLGADLWTAYELSWLNTRGKPQVALGRFMVPCESTHLVESKSLKLYLNSFNNTVFADIDAVRQTLQKDLSEAVWRGGVVQSSVGVQLLSPEQYAKEKIAEMDGLSLDRLDLDCSHFQPAPELLSAASDEAPVTETLYSNLLKSNCLVTGQPDWGSVSISYSGAQIDQAGLLQYIVSFRNHNEFHEHCVERIFMDIWTRCKPTKLTVYARYTRRGGVDINPWRSSHAQALPPQVRTARQ
ncbi:MAG: NADPH-dependent 7-cyano-7-deazaguanine reductase QueF [Burkholderiaceae bacterium]|jgi:7-cyano-7-deazaguanine reductase|nr:NADPH-dependent 7-cyano-7-deazaguanine reductase QueF [Burkholderiaceae bacterium]